MNNPRIELYEAVGLGLIICCESGITYSNQTGGTACLHPEAEGVYIPLRSGEDIPADVIAPELELIEYFEGPKYESTGATTGLDSEDLKFIQNVLSKSNLDMVQVEESKLGQSHEAWVHVSINGDEADSLPIFTGFGPYPRQAILTWQNSD